MTGPLADVDLAILLAFLGGAIVAVWSTVVIAAFLPQRLGPMAGFGPKGAFLILAALAGIAVLLIVLVLTVPLLPTAVAVIAALFGDKSIFDKVLFAWSAMGAAFGPVLLVHVLRGEVRWRPRLAAIVVGFGTSVLAYSMPATAGTAWERVAPFALALAIAWWGASSSPRAANR